MDDVRRPYHHGDLRRALLEAAETILERDGLSALTLRAAAREAGVSHAAPAHHFGDLTGLLSELAAIGYARFREQLEEAAAAPPERRAIAMGLAYVHFACARPGMFMLMFRSERLDMNRPALREQAAAAWRALSESVAARLGPALAGVSARDRLAATIAPWALAHGLACLLLDGRLEREFKDLPEAEHDMDALLEAVFRAP